MHEYVPWFRTKTTSIAEVCLNDFCHSLPAYSHAVISILIPIPTVQCQQEASGI